MKNLTIFTFLLLFVSSFNLSAKVDIPLYYNGPAAPNQYQGQLPKELTDWCNGTCIPTTQFVLFNPKTESNEGYAYVWGKDFIFGNNSQCFTEFIIYSLSQGEIYTAGNSGGTCGAVIDPSIIVPVSNPSAIVLAGGGDGKIVGGTGAFSDWVGGAYTDRVFVELLNNNINYYHSLFFLITSPKNISFIGQ